MDVLDAAKAYKEFGVAALFIGMYITTIWKFIAELKETRKEQTELIKSMTERVVTALETSKKANEDYQRMANEVKTTMDQSTRQSIEFMAFLRGRDSDRS